MPNKFAASLKTIENNTFTDNQGSGNEPAIQTAAEQPSSFDVAGVIDKLDTKDRKGRSITLYLKNEVFEQLDKISKEKNISKSKIISAVLEAALIKP